MLECFFCNLAFAMEPISLLTFNNDIRTVVNALVREMEISTFTALKLRLLVNKVVVISCIGSILHEIVPLVAGLESHER